jgi:hypothetical protein
VVSCTCIDGLVVGLGGCADSIVGWAPPDTMTAHTATMNATARLDHCLPRQPMTTPSPRLQALT